MQTTSVPRAQTTSSRDTPRTTTAAPGCRRPCTRSATTRSSSRSTPASVGAADADELRRQGWDDAAIHDAIQVIAYFNYINRVAEGVGVGPEPEWPEEGS